jgi:hypothetical protein
MSGFRRAAGRATIEGGALEVNGHAEPFAHFLRVLRAFAVRISTRCPLPSRTPQAAAPCHDIRALSGSTEHGYRQRVPGDHATLFACRTPGGSCQPLLRRDAVFHRGDSRLCASCSPWRSGVELGHVAVAEGRCSEGFRADQASPSRRAELFSLQGAVESRAAALRVIDRICGCPGFRHGSGSRSGTLRTSLRLS